MPESHPCAQLDTLRDLSALAGSKLLVMDKDVGGDCYDPLLKSILHAHGFTNSTPDYLVRNMDDLFCQVAAGRGISIVPFYNSIGMGIRGVKLIRLVGDDVPSANIVLAWNSTRVNRNKEQFLEFVERNLPGED